MSIMKNREQVARALYLAYARSAGWKNERGETMPQWEELPAEIAKHWCAVTDELAPIVDAEVKLVKPR